MNNYKIKFKNGRTTTICCSSNEELKSDLVDLTKRFNSEIATINDMPTEKLSVGGFLLGTFLGGILGNSVAKSGVKKTAKTISKKAKSTISKTRKGVSEFRSASSKSKKYSGGGSTNNQKEPYSKSFYSKSDWEKITAFLSKEFSQAETSQILNSRLMRMTGGNNYRSFVNFYNKYKKEFDQVSKEKFSGGGSTDEERYCRLAEDTGKGINEGFVIGDGDTYFESEDNLVKHLRELDYEDADGNSSKKIKSKDDLLEFFYNDEYYYYTEWDCDSEIEDQGYYYTRDGKEIELASKGKKIKSKEKINKKYTHFAVSKEDGKIADAWETLDDIETLKYYANLDLKDNDHNPKDFNILSAKTLIKRGINPYDSDNWGHFSTRATQYETGGGVNSENKEEWQIKDSDNKYYSVGIDGKIKWFESPDLGYTYFKADAEEYKNHLENVMGFKNLEVVKYNKDWWKFEDGGMSSMALAGASPQLAIGNEISKRLPATTSAVDKRIAERIYSERPSMWEDRGLKHYSKGGVLNEYEQEEFEIWKSDGNVSKNVDGTYSTQDAQWSNKLKNLTELKKYFKKEFFSDSYYSKGGTIGQQITFKHWSGDTKNGTITEDLGDGNFQVSSGFGNVLVNQEDIISSSTKSPERKKMFGFFKGGGSTEDKLLKELQNASNKTYGKGGVTYSMSDFPIYAQEEGKITYKRNVKEDFGKGLEKEYAVSVYLNGKKMRYEVELYFDTEQKANLWTEKLNNFQETIMTQTNKNYVKKYIAENDDRISELIFDELSELEANDFKAYLPKTKKKKYFGGGGVSVGYNVFNYTDNIYATDEVFKTKALANKFIKEFRNRFANQGYYRDNRMNKIDVQDIDLLAIPSDFNPLKKYENGGFVPNGYVTLIFNKKSYDFPAIYEKVNQKLILEDMDLDNSLHTPELMEFLNKEFYDWLESSNPSSEYEEMYFGEEAVFSKAGALDYAVELIMESLFEKKNQNNQQAVLNLDKYEIDYIVAFEG